MLRSQGCCNSRVFTCLSLRTYSQKPSSREDDLKILGLGSNATRQEIKDAFLKLSKLLHPDVNKKSNATEEFQRIKTAFDSLLKGSSSNQQSQTETNDQTYNMSEEFRNFKRRQERTKEMDEYLKRIRRENFKRKNNDRYTKYGDAEEGESMRFDKNKRVWFSSTEQEEYKPPPLDKDYLEYERSFIHYLEYLLFFGKVPRNESPTIPTHSSYIIRSLIKITSIVVMIVFLGSGVEIYHEMHQDKPQEVRPEYVKSLEQKSGTLDDL